LIQVWLYLRRWALRSAFGAGRVGGKFGKTAERGSLDSGSSNRLYEEVLFAV
jgi:hypothetical protein